LESVYKQNGAKCTANSTFADKSVNYIILSLAMIEIEANNRIALRNRLVINKKAILMQESAEWGIHALKSLFPRLKAQLIYDESGERILLLKMIVLLHN
jgi:hypothetical protein